MEDLILTFFKRIDQVDLFQKGGVSFIYNTNKYLSFLSENKNRLQNKEMLNLKDIYEILRKCLRKL